MKTARRSKNSEGPKSDQGGGENRPLLRFQEEAAAPDEKLLVPFDVAVASRDIEIVAKTGIARIGRRLLPAHEDQLHPPIGQTREEPRDDGDEKAMSADVK